jgi:hypothetical protein
MNSGGSNTGKNAKMQKQCCAAYPIGHAQGTINHLSHKAYNHKEKKGVINMGSRPFYLSAAR